CNFFFGKNHRKCLGSFWPFDFDRIPIVAQDILLKDSECADNLINGRRGKLVLGYLLKKIILEFIRTDEIRRLAEVSGHCSHQTDVGGDGSGGVISDPHLLEHALSEAFFSMFNKDLE